jgi:hypothetical protein
MAGKSLQQLLKLRIKELMALLLADFTDSVTVWSLSFLNMWWCLTLGEMILPVLH